MDLTELCFRNPGTCYPLTLRPPRGVVATPLDCFFKQLVLPNKLSQTLRVVI